MKAHYFQIPIFTKKNMKSSEILIQSRNKLDKYLDIVAPNTSKANLNQGQIELAYLEFAKEKSGTLFAFEFSSIFWSYWI